jgi:hypothetical protein
MMPDAPAGSNRANLLCSFVSQEDFAPGKISRRGRCG